MHDLLEIEDVPPADPEPLRCVTVENLAHAALTPPQFWIEGILPAKTVTLLGGHGGTGKSTLALTIGAHLALGVSWAGLQCRRARVAFVTLEDDSDVVRYRLRTICETLGLPAHALAESLVILDGTDS
ncbi:MAG: AAA family ATPase, partial [Thiomonas sp.]